MKWFFASHTPALAVVVSLAVSHVSPRTLQSTVSDVDEAGMSGGHEQLKIRTLAARVLHYLESKRGLAALRYS